MHRKINKQKSFKGILIKTFNAISIHITGKLISRLQFSTTGKLSILRGKLYVQQKYSTGNFIAQFVARFDIVQTFLRVDCADIQHKEEATIGKIRRRFIEELFTK